MSIKTFSDIYTDAAHRLKMSDAREIADVKNWVNIIYRDFQTRSDWYWRQKYDMLQLVPIYDTGTITVTKDSRTISGVDTVWTSAMEGRYIKVDGDIAYYRIINVVGNTSLTIDQPYYADTKTTKTYQIWKRFYNLISDVDELVNIYTEEQTGSLASEEFSCPFVTGFPRRYKKSGLDNVVITYTTGSVSGAVNTKTITGAGTSWIANVQKGDLFTPVGGSAYNVLSVNSDTQLTLVQNLTAAVTALDTYIIQRQDLIQIEFDAVTDTTMNVYYDYLKKTCDMMNDNDEPEIPLQYRDVLILGTMAIAYQYLSMEGGELKETVAVNKYEKRIDNIKDKVENEANEPSGFYFGD